MNYPKIQTIFRRDEKGNIMPGSITKREFEVIKDWTITEKIDGTNIHIDFIRDYDSGHPENWKVGYHGKTDNAQIPAPLMNHLMNTFGEQLSKYVTYFTSNDDSVKKVIIFGEGYGGSIQKGHLYSKDQKFIAYDVWIDGWWLEQLHAKAICDDLGIPFVPVLSITTPEEATGFVQINPNSCLFDDPKDIHEMEGVVATSKPMMLFRDGTPIKWKLKWSDYQKV